MGTQLVVHSRLAQCCSGGLHKSVAMKKSLPEDDLNVTLAQMSFAHDC